MTAPFLETGLEQTMMKPKINANKGSSRLSYLLSIAAGDSTIYKDGPLSHYVVSNNKFKTCLLKSSLNLILLQTLLCLQTLSLTMPSSSTPKISWNPRSSKQSNSLEELRTILLQVTSCDASNMHRIDSA